MSTTFKIKGEFNTADPDSNIECAVHSGKLSFAETKDALIRFRDHLTARIEAESECPFSPNYRGKHE